MTEENKMYPWPRPKENKLYRFAEGSVWAPDPVTALRQVTEGAARGGTSERPLGAGDITQRYLPPAAIYDPEAVEEVDMSTQIDRALGDPILNALSVGTPTGPSRPPMFGFSEEEVTPRTPVQEMDALRLLEALKGSDVPEEVLRMGQEGQPEFTLQGAAPLRSGEGMGPGGTDKFDIMPISEITQQDADALAAAQSLLGANPMTHPQLYLSDSDWILRQSIRAKQEMEADLGGEIDYSNLVFPMSLPTFMGMKSRTDPFNTDQGAIADAIAATSPDLETKVVLDPLRDGNAYTFIRDKSIEGSKWQLYDPTFMEDMASESPAIALEILAAKAIQSRVPLAGMAATPIKRQLAQAGLAGGAAVGGGMLGEAVKDVVIDEFYDIPRPSSQDRYKDQWSNELKEMALMAGISETAVRAGTFVPKATIGVARNTWGILPGTWKAAWRSFVNEGGPRPLPAMMSTIGAARLNRVWLMTNRGRKDMVGRFQQGMKMFDNFINEIGDPLGPMNRENAEILMGKFNKKLKEGLRKGFPEFQGWRKTIGKTRDWYYKYNNTNWELFRQRFTREADKLFNFGATFDMTGLQRNLLKTFTGPESIKVSNIWREGVEETISWAEVKDPTVLRMFEHLTSMPQKITTREEFEVLRQMKDTLASFNKEKLDNAAERNMFDALQKGIDKVLKNPGFPAGMPKKIKGDTGYPVGQIEGKHPALFTYLKTFDDYAAWRETDGWILGASLIGQLTPEAIGRSILDPIKNPSVVKTLFEMAKKNPGISKGDKILWQNAYIQKIMGNMTPDAAIKILRGGELGLDEQEAFDLLVPKDTQKKLLKYFHTSRDFINNPQVVTLLTDVSRNGKILVDTFKEDPAQFRATVDALEQIYPGQGKHIAAWSILKDLLRKSTERVDDSIVLNKGQAKKALTYWRNQGILDNLLTKKQLRRFDDMLASVEQLPEGNMATSLAVQERAGKTMGLLTAIPERIYMARDAIHAWFMLDSLVGAPLGIGKGGAQGTVTSRYLIGNSILAMDRIERMGEKYKPADAWNIPFPQLVDNLKRANIFVVESDPANSDPNAQRALQDVMRDQFAEQKAEMAQEGFVEKMLRGEMTMPKNAVTKFLGDRADDIRNYQGPEVTDPSGPPWNRPGR